MKYLFSNNRQNAIKLPGKDGKLVHFAGNEKKVLDDFFKRYVPKQLTVIKIIREEDQKPKGPKIITKRKPNNTNNIRIIKPEEIDLRNKVGSKRRIKSVISKRTKGTKRVVGRAGVIGRRDATEFSVARIEENSIGISNHIGIGILSFNRLKSLIHLIESIRKHTDLNKTTVFVSDESTDGKTWEWLKKQRDIIVFHNDRNGIAANSNRLLRCLKRFKYKILLNDDVEVLKPGWDTFYFDMMDKFNLKHFCYRQEGIYGAVRGKSQNGLLFINDKPHGAVLAIHDDAFKKVGYFDENFGTYGFEHVDYSNRISMACHEKQGFYDVVGSDKYFRIYNDNTSDPQKHENYNKAREYYNNIKENKNRIYVEFTNKSKIPAITCIIPFRDIGRSKCIETVVNNIRTLKYPEVQIILAEQDDQSRINKNRFPCIDHVLVKSPIQNMHFSKSLAFNKGVSLAEFENMILHDADMLVRSDYASKIVGLLEQYESAHIGKTVCYMERESTDRIVKEQSIQRDNISSDRIVNYYEGGSLAIRKQAYIKIGGFCEKFIGYGCEDCEFYHRMTIGTNNYTIRSIDLFHLWHDRTSGWTEKHEINKQIQEKLFKMDQKALMKELSQYLKDKYKL